MKHRLIIIRQISFLMVLACLLPVSAFAAEGFYKKPNLFNFWHPNERTAKQVIDHFGPVGMKIELRLPAFQMFVGQIEEGSPAQATGKLKLGQKIESINGQVLKDIDPRIQLAKMISDAEATDGKMRFSIRDEETSNPYEVVVQLPILGAYSSTWPLNCKKSDKIVRNMANWVKTKGGYDLDTMAWKSLNGFGMLFLLSTGDESDLEHVRGWIKQVVEQYKDEEKILLKPWVFGSAAIPLAEYYLRTGDKSILPVIQKIANHACGTMYNGGWSGRGGLVFGYMTGGHMNAAGMHVPTFLMLAKECGVMIDEKILLASLKHHYRFAGKGSMPYGDHYPETYFIDNGKNGALAFTMAAAASLTPDGEKSIYAKARDISAMRGFYGTNYMLTGHTGGGIGEVWRGPAMALIKDKEPTKYRSFMDGRQWHLEMSRRYDGSFAILNGTSRYDRPTTWGQMMALQYTAPRKTLRLTGSTRPKWSKPHQLPATPWGTEADNDFCETKPAVDANGKSPSFDDTLEGGTINGVERQFRTAADTKALSLKYCLHPDHEMRREMGAGGIKGNKLDKEIIAMLKHKDARVRRAALSAIHVTHKGTRFLAPDRLTDEMANQVIAMVKDPKESWWVLENALRVMSVLPTKNTAPHLEHLLTFLEHEDWWLQNAALKALAPLAVKEAHYTVILPKIAHLIVNNTRAAATLPIGDITKRLKTASPKIQEAMLATLTQSYSDFPPDLTPPAGDASADQLKGDMKMKVVLVSLRTIAQQIISAPGGLNALYKVAKARNPHESLPYKQHYLWANYDTFTPELKAVIKPIVLDELVPDFIARNLGSLQKELSKGGQAHCLLTNLAALHRKAGTSEYEWKNFGPDRNEMKWHYMITPTTGVGRTLKPSLPESMEKWNKPDFEPAKAGWKLGQAPFGHQDGKLKTVPSGCSNPICRCGDAMKTLWVKDALLLKGTFKFPATKPGHSYRLLVSSASHVNMNSPISVYLNGKHVASGGGAGRGQGGRAKGKLLSQAMIQSFNDKEVVLSALCYPRSHKRRKPGNFFTAWVEEMKNPPVNKDLAWKGLNQIPLQSSAWQQDQISDTAELSTGEGLYKFNGVFVANPKVLGTWLPIGRVSNVAEFKAGIELDKTMPRYRSITFKEKGFSDSTIRYWSGNTLMELGKSASALKMKTKTIGVDEYLFIETGGFTFYHERQHYKHPRTWKSPWHVLKKK